MAKYLLLKHYRGGPAPAVDWAPMDQWTPDEDTDHRGYEVPQQRLVHSVTVGESARNGRTSSHS